MHCSDCFHYDACRSMANTSVLVEVDFGGDCDHYVHKDDVTVKRDTSHDIEIDI